MRLKKMELCFKTQLKRWERVNSLFILLLTGLLVLCSSNLTNHRSKAMSPMSSYQQLGFLTYKFWKGGIICSFE